MVAAIFFFFFFFEIKLYAALRPRHLECVKFSTTYIFANRRNLNRVGDCERSILIINSNSRRFDRSRFVTVLC